MHFDCLATAVPVNFTLCRWVALVQCTKTALLRRVQQEHVICGRLHLSSALKLRYYESVEEKKDG